MNLTARLSRLESLAVPALPQYHEARRRVLVRLEAKLAAGLNALGKGPVPVPTLEGDTPALAAQDGRTIRRYEHAHGLTPPPFSRERVLAQLDRLAARSANVSNAMRRGGG
jgi:hypothetical protein